MVSSSDFPRFQIIVDRLQRLVFALKVLGEHGDEYYAEALHEIETVEEALILLHAHEAVTALQEVKTRLASVACRKPELRWCEVHGLIEVCQSVRRHAEQAVCKQPRPLSASETVARAAAA